MEIIADFMVSPVISIDSQATAEEAAILFSEKNISSLLVKESEEFVGIITKTDIINRVIAKRLDPKATKINNVMSKPLLTMDQYLQRSEANQLMLSKKIKHLAVTKIGKVVGMLTLKDMVQ